MSYIDNVLPDMRRAARTVAAKWPQVTTEEDMTNTLVVHFMEAPGALQTLAELPSDKRVARLTAIGHERASAERDDREVFSGQFTYSVDEVKQLLERGALAGHVNGFDAGREDLLQAIRTLHGRTPNYADAIWLRYDQAGKPNRDALSRGIEALTTLMNRVSSNERYQFNNGGRFRNNRQALNQADLDYNGEGRYDD